MLVSERYQVLVLEYTGSKSSDPNVSATTHRNEILIALYFQTISSPR